MERVSAVLRRVAGPLDSVNSDRALESFDGDFSQVLEGEALPNAQFGDHVRYQNLIRLCVGTEPCGQLNRRSEEILLMLDRFSRRGADPDLDRALGVFLLILSQRPLNPSCAPNRRRCRHKRRHDAVASMLDLTTA
jgi:hypothetical protein